MTYLVQAGLAEAPRSGSAGITNCGREALTSTWTGTLQYLQQLQGLQAFLASTKVLEDTPHLGRLLRIA